jgi:hypothetical protein
MKNKMTDLRNHLFEVIERLKDPEEADRMNIETARQITETAQVIVNSAKVEVDFLKAIDAPFQGTGFIGGETTDIKMIGEKRS